MGYPTRYHIRAIHADQTLETIGGHFHSYFTACDYADALLAGDGDLRQVRVVSESGRNCARTLSVCHVATLPW